MTKLFLIIFLTNITLSQLFANSRCEHKHTKIQVPEFFFEHEELFEEQGNTRPTVDDYLDLMWEDIPPTIQKIILCFGGIGIFVIAASIDYPNLLRF